jgi:hypothetical protein
MPAFSSSIEITNVDTVQRMPLGFEVEIDANDDNGPQVWVYTKNGEASTAFAVGNLIQRKASSTTKIGTIGSTTALPVHGYLGVAQHAIAAGSYGFILKKGRGLVLADTGNITANQALIPGNAVAGAFDSSSTATASSLGWAPAAITAAATGYAFVNCPG